jgi:hypothetical protein
MIKIIGFVASIGLWTKNPQPHSKVHATRTDSGRPSAAIRLRHLTLILNSVCGRPSVVSVDVAEIPVWMGAALALRVGVYSETGNRRAVAERQIATPPCHLPLHP